MEKKGIVLLNYEDKSRKLNYVTKEDGKVVVITSGKSNKVAYMKANKKVTLVFGTEVVAATPTIITEQEKVKADFEFMSANNNNHFKAYNDMFVAVEFSL